MIAIYKTVNVSGSKKSLGAGGKLAKMLYFAVH